MSRPTAQEAFKALSQFCNNFNSDDEAFVKEFRKEHRTLQQSVARVMIKCLEEAAQWEDRQIDARNKSLRDVARKTVGHYEEETGYKASESLPTI